jgi:hypothetical protein
MTQHYEHLKEQILRLVSGAPNHRIRPYEAARTLSHAQGISRQMFHQAVWDLVKEGQLAYTYQEPCSFVERSEPHLPGHAVG